MIVRGNGVLGVNPHEGMIDTALVLQNTKKRYLEAIDYLYGVNKEINTEKAVGMLEFMAYKQNYAPAWRTLGTLYIKGIGVHIDEERAYRYFLKAAKLGDNKAMVNIGLMYSKGICLPQNYEKAFKWFQAGWAMGNKRACYYLGYSYHKGYGTTQDYEQALTYFQEGADLEQASCVYMLALCYLYGKGVEQDIEYGKQLMEHAALLGADRASDFILSGRLNDSNKRKNRPKNDTNPLEKLLPDEHQLVIDNTQNVELSGVWNGMLVEYDWSGMRIQDRYDLQLDVIKKNHTMEGTWTINSEIVPFVANLSDSVWTFESGNYHSKRGAELVLDKANFVYSIAENAEILEGDLHIRKVRTQEPGNPLYVLLQRNHERKVQSLSQDSIMMWVSPNPIADKRIEFYIKAEDEQIVQVSVYDINSNCLYMDHLKVLVGTNKYYCDVPCISGIYVLQLLSRQVSVMEKIVIL